MPLGLIRGSVAVENHSAEWEEIAKETIRILKEVANDDIVDAQHIGSTSVKGICAKPIVDIVVGVKHFEDILKYNDVFEDKGIIYRREDRPGQHLYVMGDLERGTHTHYIHVVIWGDDAWNNYINMRDYLNAHDEKANEYSALKKSLAEKYSNDREGYTRAKSNFIEKVLQEAKVWRNYL